MKFLAVLNSESENLDQIRQFFPKIMTSHSDVLTSS